MFLSCDICHWDRCQATIIQAPILLIKKVPDAQASGIYLSCLRYYLGNLVDDLDINDFAVDDRHLFVLAIIGRVVVDRGFIAVVVAVIGIHGIWIIVIN